MFAILYTILCVALIAAFERSSPESPGTFALMVFGIAWPVIALVVAWLIIANLIQDLLHYRKMKGPKHGNQENFIPFQNTQSTEAREG